VGLTLAALAGPTLLAAFGGHIAFAAAAILAFGCAYLAGYTDAARRYRQHLARGLAEARKDPLTGLPNRALADELLDTATRTGASMTAASVSSPPAPTPCFRTPSAASPPPADIEENAMRFVAPPTHVGEHRWPVLSAVRVNTGDQPAEFVVLVDCGDGTPEHPYATLRVSIWPEQRKVSQGQYNLTFDQARRHLAERAGLLPATVTVEVVVVRDPVAANDYAIFVDGTRIPDGHTGRVRVITHDVDLGVVDLTPAQVAEYLQQANALSPAAARHARNAILAFVDDPNVDHPQPYDIAAAEPAPGSAGAPATPRGLGWEGTA